MFLRQNKRRKNGKLHRYFSVVEYRRTAAGSTQRQVLYLGGPCRSLMKTAGNTAN